MLHTLLTSCGLSISHVSHSSPLLPLFLIPNLAPSPYFRISAVLVDAFASISTLFNVYIINNFE